MPESSHSILLVTCILGTCILGLKPISVFGKAENNFCWRVLVQEEAGIGSEMPKILRRDYHERRARREWRNPDLFPFCFYRKLGRSSAQMRIGGDRGQEHPLDRLLGGGALARDRSGKPSRQKPASQRVFADRHLI